MKRIAGFIIALCMITQTQLQAVEYELRVVSIEGGTKTQTNYYAFRFNDKTQAAPSPGLTIKGSGYRDSAGVYNTATNFYEMVLAGDPDKKMTEGATLELINLNGQIADSPSFNGEYIATRFEVTEPYTLYGFGIAVKNISMGVNDEIRLRGELWQGNECIAVSQYSQFFGALSTMTYTFFFAGPIALTTTGANIDPEFLDSDNDGWTDKDEEEWGTNPHDGDDYPGSGVDSDGDGVSDRDEEAAGTDPNDPADKPADIPDINIDKGPLTQALEALGLDISSITLTNQNYTKDITFPTGGTMSSITWTTYTFHLNPDNMPENKAKPILIYCRNFLNLFCKFCMGFMFFTGTYKMLWEI